MGFWDVSESDVHWKRAYALRVEPVWRESSRRFPSMIVAVLTVYSRKAG